MYFSVLSIFSLMCKYYFYDQGMTVSIFYKIISADHKPHSGLCPGLFWECKFFHLLEMDEERILLSRATGLLKKTKGQN